MANRHLSRSIVLQTLFEWDFTDFDDSKTEDTLVRVAEEFAPGVGDLAFMKNLLNGTIKKRNELDEIITNAAPDWPLEKISTVDRNILRLGLYELLFADRSEVPAKVAINEAIELAKSFGGENSGKFVNGVLGAVYKEIGEPGKDETGPKKREEVPYDEMPVEQKAGALIFARDGEEVYLGFVHDIFGYWTLSKGGVEEGEELKDAAARAIKNEMGIDVTVTEELGVNEYVANHPEKGKHRKHVVYFLAEGKYEPLTLAPDKGGLDKAEWFPMTGITDLNFYNDIFPIVTKAIGIITSDSKE